MTTTGQPPESTITAVLGAMRARLAALDDGRGAQREFLQTYRRTTEAVGRRCAAGRSRTLPGSRPGTWRSPPCTCGALDADLSGRRRGARPWRLAFDAPAELPPLRHVLLGINAHVNYDLPQALLAVISDEEFADPLLLDATAARPRADRRRTRGARGGRGRRARRPPSRKLLDRALQPLNRLALPAVPARGPAEGLAQHHRTAAGPVAGPRAYAVRLAELELLSAARIADLLAPGQVLLRLAVAGFGVMLPPPVQG